jgi:hypothetical protein
MTFIFEWPRDKRAIFFFDTVRGEIFSRVQCINRPTMQAWPYRGG